mmetsp:Transcript_18877/g.48659  ORF Transcript_18877/g.48659 Transcript_18877/m.48659 type:complete len:267 (-) Transcript_18877:4-804(-)
MQRSVLTQPLELIDLAHPPAKPATAAAAAAGGAAGAGEKAPKQKKARPMSTWAEAFVGAMQMIEANAPKAHAHAKALLDQALASADKPGTPREAPVITFRGLGYLHAAVAEYQQASIAYIRALGHAERLTKAGDAPPRARALHMGCHRDLAVLLRELGRHADAAKQWGSALKQLEALGSAANGLLPGPTRSSMPADAPPPSPPPASPTSSAISPLEWQRGELTLCTADCLLAQRDKADLAPPLVASVLEAREAACGPGSAVAAAAV